MPAEMYEVQVAVMEMALVYRTLLSIVPLLAIGFSGLKYWRGRIW